MTGGPDVLVQRILSRQAAVGVCTFVAIALLTPQLLLLEWSVGAGVLSVGWKLALVAIVATAAFSLVRLRAHRFLVRSIALGSRAIEAEDLRGLAAIPTALTLRFFAMTTIFASLLILPGIRPDRLDGGRAASMLILSITIIGAAAVPHYVLVRSAIVGLLELCPPEPVSAVLESEELKLYPRNRTIAMLLLSVVLPVALVGVGAVLIAHAHLRTFIEDSRKETAIVVARAALEPSVLGVRDAGRQDAIAAAAEHGFIARVDRSTPPAAEPAFTREADGQITARAPVDDGTAFVRFSADLDPAMTTTGAVVALLAVFLAGVLGTLFGRFLADDIALATGRVRALGTETVLRDKAEIGAVARFGWVANLGRAIEGLTERFRVFAAAQERAIDARENARKMRGLLFASVSHDLKSPLNAILGFAEIVGQQDLSLAQRESLTLIVRRGRELLALIETILDAARVEARQLALSPRKVDVGELVSESVRKARELSSDARAPLVLEVGRTLPSVPVDPAYMVRALAVVVAHALRAADADVSSASRPVRVRATLEETPEGPEASREGGRVRIDVEHGSREVTVRELEALFARQSTSRGRGLTLGLSLARSVIELHGGMVAVDRAPDGAAIARCGIPLVVPKPEARRVRTTSSPPK